MAKILAGYKHYPISMARYFVRALRRAGHEVFTVGPYFEGLPWAQGMTFEKYLDRPDFETPDLEWFPISLALGVCPWKPDLILSLDAGFHLCYRGNPHFDTPHALFMTDPHALDYTHQCEDADFIFCAQDVYADRYRNLGYTVHWLPYAYDPEWHWGNPYYAARPGDIAIVTGLVYANRALALGALDGAGLKVGFATGLLGPDLSKFYSGYLMALNWSSQLDLPCKFWEGLAMGNLVITNRLPDLAKVYDLREDVDYVAFDTLSELLDKAKYFALHRDEAFKIAWHGHNQVVENHHTYDRRVEYMLACCGVK